MNKYRKLNYLFFINLFLLLTNFSELNSAKITYEVSGGRLGDNLLAYCHAKWLSFMYDIPLVYLPFKYSEELKIHEIEDKITPVDISKKSKLKKIIDIKNSSDTVYSVPYFGEDLTEHRKNNHWIYFKVDWENPKFKQSIQKSIDPLNSQLKNINLPKDCINVAVHIRQGGGYDQPLSNSNIQSDLYVDLDFPLKFPPLQFYIDQIKKVSEIFKHAQLYIYVFTDDKNPESLVTKIQEQMKEYNNIVFDFRKKDNLHNKNVLEDFFAITQFDCLIRSQSNFSFMASKISDYKLEIFPTDYFIKNRELIINKVKIIYENKSILEFEANFLVSKISSKIITLNKRIAAYKKKIINDPENRKGSYPFISGDSFRGISDHIFDETCKLLNPTDIKTNDIVFLKTDYMKEFFSVIHPKIKNKYILITHNSDLGAPANYESYLDDPKIIKWFGMNPTIKNHDKFIAIPIGVANRYVPHGNLDTFNNLVKNKKNQKAYLLGINFYPTAKERNPLFSKFSKLKFCKDLRAFPHKAYLDKMTQAKFILSPPGNGLDCHRTWEVLLAGSMPIVMASNLDSIHEDLPILIINNWDEITEEYLNKQYEEFIKKDFDTDKLYFNYWYTLIESFKINVEE